MTSISRLNNAYTVSTCYIAENYSGTCSSISKHKTLDLFSLASFNSDQDCTIFSREMGCLFLVYWSPRSRQKMFGTIIEISYSSLCANRTYNIHI